MGQGGITISNEVVRVGYMEVEYTQGTEGGKRTGHVTMFQEEGSTKALMWESSAWPRARRTPVVSEGKE